MGDFNIPAETLEGSGILDAMNLTLIRVGDGMNTCSMGSGSQIDYALVTSAFVPAIVSVNAVRTVPWCPHCGLRATFRTNTAQIRVPEIVSPLH